MKIQEALARNENQINDADEINKWFVDFTGILHQIFQDNDLCLKFNYKDYSFHILSHGKNLSLRSCQTAMQQYWILLLI